MLLVALDRQRVAPPPARVAAVVALSVATWFAHPSPLMVVDALVAVHVVARGTWGERLRAARSLLLPLVPATVVALYSGVVHLHGTDAHADIGDATDFPTPLWLAYDLWAHWGYGYTALSVSSLVLMAVLAALGLGRARTRVAFFDAWGALTLVAGYVLAPYYTVTLFYAGARIIPFVWMAALLRLPDRLPRLLPPVLAVCSAAYVAAMAVDQVRLAREEDAFAAGVDAVPRGARMDVFTFSPRLTSKNTWSLGTSWGEYVVARHAHSWEVWADSPSLPIQRRTLPTPRLEPRLHHRFLETMQTRAGFCLAREAMGLDPQACDAEWRAQWAAYWREVEPYVDVLLFWDPPPDALAQVPGGWRPSFQRGRLWIFERDPSRKEPQLHVDAAAGSGGGR